MKGKVSLYYNQITIGLQSGYNQLHHLLHLGSTQYKQFLNIYKKKKKKKTTKGKEKKNGERKKKERAAQGVRCLMSLKVISF